MGGDLDVIIDADAACPSFRELVWFARQGFQRRAVDLFQQLLARHAEPPDRAAGMQIDSLLNRLDSNIANRPQENREAVTRSFASSPGTSSM